jgi:hypothetical protein
MSAETGTTLPGVSRGIEGLDVDGLRQAIQEEYALAQSSSAAQFGTLGINFRAQKARDETEWAKALATLTCERPSPWLLSLAWRRNRETQRRWQAPGICRRYCLTH